MNHDDKNACPAIRTDEQVPALQTEENAPGWREQGAGWLQAIGQMLERAAKRIGENFRVPPNGG